MSSEAICEWCNQPFERPHNRGPAPRFCSASHRQRAHEFRRGYGTGIEAASEAMARSVNVNHEAVAKAFANIQVPDMTAISKAFSAAIQPNFDAISKSAASMVVPDMTAIDRAIALSMPDMTAINQAIANMVVPDMSAMSKMIATIAMPDMTAIQQAIANVMTPGFESLQAVIANVTAPQVASLFASFNESSVPVVDEDDCADEASDLPLIDPSFAASFSDWMDAVFTELEHERGDSADADEDSLLRRESAQQLAYSAGFSIALSYLVLEAGQRLTPLAMMLFVQGLKSLDLAIRMFGQLSETQHMKGIAAIFMCYSIAKEVKRLAVRPKELEHGDGNNPPDERTAGS